MIKTLVLDLSIETLDFTSTIEKHSNFIQRVYGFPDGAPNASTFLIMKSVDHYLVLLRMYDNR